MVKKAVFCLENKSKIVSSMSAKKYDNLTFYKKKEFENHNSLFSISVNSPYVFMIVVLGIGVYIHKIL